MEALAELQIMIRGWIELYGIAAISEKTKLSAHHIRKTYNTINPNEEHLELVVTSCREMDKERTKSINVLAKKIA